MTSPIYKATRYHGLSLPEKGVDTAREAYNLGVARAKEQALYAWFTRKFPVHGSAMLKLSEIVTYWDELSAAIDEAQFNFNAQHIDLLNEAFPDPGAPEARR